MYQFVIKMSKQKLVHSPTLRTILMVENTLKDCEESLITVAQLKRILPKQINHNTLIEILDYLEKSNKIVMTIKGITWTYNPSPKFKAMLKKAVDY